jgi:hypothetical protein
MRALRLAAHVLVIAFGWCLYLVSWALVTSRLWDDRGLLLLIVGAMVLMPALAIAWILHNVAIYRRLGPRREVTPAVVAYETDFYGRHVVADWEGMRRCAFVVIECDEGVKSYRPEAPDLGAPVNASGA